MTEDAARERLAQLLGNQLWRMSHLYWIEDKDGRLVRFRPLPEQLQLLQSDARRLNVLKVRQLGISTFGAIRALDHCLTRKNWHAGMVDKTLEDATQKLLKVRRAYELLDYVPEDATPQDRALAAIGAELKRGVSLVTSQAKSLAWSNGSRYRVGTGMRGGTLQELHVSELSSISYHAPKRAHEIRTGALNTVGANCLVLLESTHEGGRSGINYDLVCRAMANVGRELSPLDFRFFFFPWWEHESYRLEARFWTRTLDPHDPQYELLANERAELVRYFERLREESGIELSDEQKAWYASQYAANGSAVRQEYPSTPEEAFSVLDEGAIYAEALGALRASGRLDAEFEPEPLLPVYVFWDLGMSDPMALWLVQVVGGRVQLLDHYSANNLPIDHYVAVVREWERAYGISVTKMFVPHDGSHRDYSDSSFARMLQRAGFAVHVLERTRDVWVGIHAARMGLRRCWFHRRCNRETCVGKFRYPSGISALENYRTAPTGAPLHDIHSNSADAFRYIFEADRAGLLTGDSAGDCGHDEPYVGVGAEFLGQW